MPRRASDDSEDLVATEPLPDEVIAPVSDELDDDEPIVETELLPEPAREISVVVKSNALRCPYCREDIDSRKKNWVACASCLARHHKGCWREAKKCATCGLRKHLVAPGAMSVPASRARVPGIGRETRRLLGHEAHIKAIAFWGIFGGALLTIVSLFLLLAAQGSHRSEAGMIAFGFFAVSAGFLASGVALWGYVSWARKVTIVLNVAALILGFVAASSAFIDTGTLVSLGFNVVWSAATIWALTCGQANGIFHPLYAGLMARDSHVKPNWVASPFFWGPWVVFAIQIVIALSSGPVPHRYY